MLLEGRSWNAALGMLEGCSWSALGMLLLPWCWRGVAAELLEGVLGGCVLGRFLLRGLRFPDEGSEWNKTRARV